jgi:putative hydrolase of the HAD superfamily
MTTIRAVIFDLDDTLFDHTTSATMAVRSWVSELGTTPTDELVAQWFEIEERQFDLWLAGEVSHSEQRRRRLREFLPLLSRPVPPTEDAQDLAFESFLGWYRGTWAAFSDARPALEVARSNDWRIGVLTNGSTSQQNAKLASIGLADLVDVVSTAQGLGVGKPEVAAFHLTCEALDVQPAEALMIGDNLEVDVLGARAAGLAALHLDRAAGITLVDLVRRTS